MKKLILAGLLLSWGAHAIAANPEDKAINQVYDSIATAAAENSGDGIVTAFAEDALILDPRNPTPTGGKAFRSAIVGMAQRLKADGVSVSAKYRVTERIVSGDMAVDTGYRRQSMVRSAAGPAPMDMVTEFLVVMRRTPAGWKIVRDASLPATEAAWAGAARSDGLKYDG